MKFAIIEDKDAGTFQFEIGLNQSKFLGKHTNEWLDASINGYFLRCKSVDNLNVYFLSLRKIPMQEFKEALIKDGFVKVEVPKVKPYAYLY